MIGGTCAHVDVAVKVNEVALRIAEVERSVPPGLGAGWFDPVDRKALQSRVLPIDVFDDELDHGPIVLQRAVPVLESDDVDALSARILEQEHIGYSEAIATVLSGDCVIEGRCVKVKS